MEHKEKLYTLTRQVRVIIENSKDQKEIDYLQKLGIRLYDDYWREVESESFAYKLAMNYVSGAK